MAASFAAAASSLSCAACASYTCVAETRERIAHAHRIGSGQPTGMSEPARHSVSETREGRAFFSSSPMAFHMAPIFCMISVCLRSGSDTFSFRRVAAQNLHTIPAAALSAKGKRAVAVSLHAVLCRFVGRARRLCVGTRGLCCLQAAGERAGGQRT